MELGPTAFSSFFSGVPTTQWTRIASTVEPQNPAHSVVLWEQLPLGQAVLRVGRLESTRATESGPNESGLRPWPGPSYRLHSRQGHRKVFQSVLETLSTRETPVLSERMGGHIDHRVHRPSLRQWEVQAHTSLISESGWTGTALVWEVKEKGPHRLVPPVTS